VSFVSNINEFKSFFTRLKIEYSKNNFFKNDKDMVCAYIALFIIKKMYGVHSENKSFISSDDFTNIIVENVYLLTI
jgi:hypothetical protein